MNDARPEEKNSSKPESAAAPESTATPEAAEKTARKAKFMRRLDITLSLLILIPALLYAADFLLGIRHTVTEVDLGSGRLRQTDYLLNHPTDQSTRETLLSKALAPAPGQSARPDWRPVETFQTARGRRLPGKFSDVLTLETDLPLYWKLGNCDAAAQRESARTALALMRIEGGTAAAGRYLQALAKTATIAMKLGLPLGAADLPTSATAVMPAEGGGLDSLLRGQLNAK